MGEDLHHSIITFFEKKMSDHSNVSSIRKLSVEEEHVYEIKRKKFSDTIRVWLSDAYKFDDMNFVNRPRQIKKGDYILIAKPEATPSRGYSQEKIRIGKIGDFMGALSKERMWLYAPPSDDEKKSRSR
jgi:hypothetical protein